MEDGASAGVGEVQTLAALETRALEVVLEVIHVDLLEALAGRVDLVRVVQVLELLVDTGLTVLLLVDGVVCRVTDGTLIEEVRFVE